MTAFFVTEMWYVAAQSDSLPQTLTLVFFQTHFLKLHSNL